MNLQSRRFSSRLPSCGSLPLLPGSAQFPLRPFSMSAFESIRDKATSGNPLHRTYKLEVVAIRIGERGKPTISHLVGRPDDLGA